MKLQELKYELEHSSNFKDNLFIIFKYSDNDFLAKQYINQIAKLKQLPVVFIDKIEFNKSKDLFNINETPDQIRIFETNIFELDDVQLFSEQNLFVICKKITNEKLFEQNTINLPKLEKWQISDYVYSIANGVPEKDLDYLIELCNYDIYRLEQELKKLKIFDEKEQNYVFQSLKQDDAFNDLSNYSIFNFTNALLKKDKAQLLSIYKEIDRIDIEPVGLITVLYNNLKNIIKIQLARNPSPETTNIDKKQFYAIQKYSCGFYTPQQLIQLFLKITDLDRQFKSGYISVNYIIDYILQFCFAI